METITLRRDVSAVAIPYGDRVPLPSGMEVTVHQVLGGNYTVVTDRGTMVRIDARDADALGKEVVLTPAGVSPGAAGPPTTEEEVRARVWEQLRTCFDPEIPVNIVELGLVYECVVTPRPAGGFHVDVQMTLTAPGCGMGPVLQQDAQMKILSIPGVVEADVQVVFEPPWDASRMTDAARLQLGML